MLHCFDLQPFDLVDDLVDSGFELDGDEHCVAFPVGLVDVDLHEFDVFHFSLEGVSGPEDVLVELGLDGADVAPAIFFVLSEGLLQNLVDFVFDEVELGDNDRHHLSVKALEFGVK